MESDVVAQGSAGTCTLPTVLEPAVCFTPPTSLQGPSTIVASSIGHAFGVSRIGTFGADMPKHHLRSKEFSPGDVIARYGTRRDGWCTIKP